MLIYACSDAFLCCMVMYFLTVMCKKEQIFRNKQKKTKRNLRMFPVTDCSLLSPDSSCQVTSFVEKFRRPAALVCIRSRKTPSLRQTPGPMPLGCVLCMDQSEGPIHPGIDDSCMTVGLRGRGLYLAFIWMLWLIFFLICPAFYFLQLFIFLRFAVTHGLASLMKLGNCINKYV